MARYSHFLGATVKVLYRIGDVLLTASGNFVGDSGRSIFLEQHLEQRGKRNYFRWEIPYPYIHRIEALVEPAELDVPPSQEKASAASAGIGDAASSTSMGLSFPQRKTV